MYQRSLLLPPLPHQATLLVPICKGQVSPKEAQEILPSLGHRGWVTESHPHEDRTGASLGLRSFLAQHVLPPVPGPTSAPMTHGVGERRGQDIPLVAEESFGLPGDSPSPPIALLGPGTPSAPAEATLVSERRWAEFSAITCRHATDVCSPSEVEGNPDTLSLADFLPNFCLLL